MQITKTRVTVVKDTGKNLRAFVDITFDDCFVVTSLRVIDGRNGLFVAMPSRKRDDGSWQDIAHPITGDFRKEINDTVLREYESAVAAGPDQQDAPF
jgi:stage V sporulation protein G